MKNRLKPREVNEVLSDIGDLPNIPTPEETDVGKYLKVGSGGYELGDVEEYTPPAYSTTEANTGQKWTDGRDIYFKTYTGTISTNYQTIDENFDAQNEIIKADAYVATSDGSMSNGYISTSWCCAVSYNASQFLNVYTGSGLSGGTYKVTVYYVKPVAEAKKKKTK